jgi:hypothetical protein
MGIREDWINTGPAPLLDFGLPAGFANRTVERRYGGWLYTVQAVETRCS